MVVFPFGLATWVIRGDLWEKVIPKRMRFLDAYAALEHLQRCSVCDPAKIFFTFKFSCVLFCNLTNKTETGTSNKWGTTNSKPPGPIIMMNQSETPKQQLDHFNYTFFCRCTALLCRLPATAAVHNYAEPNWHTLDFLHPILLCRITYRAPLEMLLSLLAVENWDSSLCSSWFSWLS
jgi:hypothetical protein